MKKLLVLIALLLFSGITFSQTLQKGNLVGFHVLDITLNPDVTYNQWKDITLNKYIPALNKAYQGDATVYLLEGIRGEEENGIGWIVIFKSEEARNKYFDKEGTGTELYNQRMKEIVNPLMEEVSSPMKSINRKYSDWLVQ